MNISNLYLLLARGVRCSWRPFRLVEAHECLEHVLEVNTKPISVRFPLFWQVVFELGGPRKHASADGFKRILFLQVFLYILCANFLLKWEKAEMVLSLTVHNFDYDAGCPEVLDFSAICHSLELRFGVTLLPEDIYDILSGSTFEHRERENT